MNRPPTDDASERARAARRLARRVVGFADVALRVKYLSHVAAQMRPRRLADLFTLARHGAEARDGDLAALHLGLCLALARPEHSATRHRVAHAAAGAGQHETAAQLSPRPGVRTLEVDPRVPDFGKGRPLGLGERKSLARRRDRDLIARVIRDPSPDVIRILLGNPALREDDVLRICAARPALDTVLREVMGATRWIVRYGVRRALIHNPFTPLDIALQLSVHLNAQDARAVAVSTELATPLREACAALAAPPEPS